MTEQDQVDALYAHQVTSDLERELVEALPARIDPYRDATRHVVDLYEVVLETGRLAFFKPLNAYQNATTPLKRALLNYGHTPVSTLVSECAAWQLAKRLGERWKELVAPSVLRGVELPGRGREVGSLALFRPGEVRKRNYVHAVPEQAASGAFFDCLVGQQDRNPGNVLWHEERSRIYLIDHGFAFARPGDRTGHLELTAWRWQRGSRALDDFELAAVSRLIDEGLGDLRGYLAEDRAGALLSRAQRLQQHGEILPPGEL